MTDLSLRVDIPDSNDGVSTSCEEMTGSSVDLKSIHSRFVELFLRISEQGLRKTTDEQWSGERGEDNYIN